MVLIDSGMFRDVRQGRDVNERMCGWDRRSDRENFMGRRFQPVRTAGLRRGGPVPLKAGARRPDTSTGVPGGGIVMPNGRRSTNGISMARPSPRALT